MREQHGATSVDSFGQMAQQALEARAVSNTNWSGHNSESYGRFDAIIPFRWGV